MKLVPFNTKLQEGHRDKLKALVQVSGAAGDREMIERFMAAYAEQNPEHMQKATRLLSVLGDQRPDDPSNYPGEQEAPDAPVSFPHLVDTIKYVGKPYIHLAERTADGSAWRTPCGLAGQVDQDTHALNPTEDVTCKKCRYARKAVFQ